MPDYRLVPLLLLFLATTSPALGRGESYCCQDSSSGRRICGDTLPDACRGRAHRVLDSGGNVLKEVGPPLTAEQKAEQAAEALRKKQLEEAHREQQRKDQALLDTYASPKDIDLSQRKAEADVSLAIQTIQGQIDQAQKKRKKLEDEAEFYKKKTLPAELSKELRTLESEIKAQQEILAARKKDFDAIKSKYDIDRQRYYAITGRTPRATPSSVTESARPR